MTKTYVDPNFPKATAHLDCGHTREVPNKMRKRIRAKDITRTHCAECNTHRTVIRLVDPVEPMKRRKAAQRRNSSAAVALSTLNAQRRAQQMADDT